jgi:S-adenosyl methyltransferase
VAAMNGLPSRLDTTKAQSVRVWDYLSGGKDNFAADRQLAEQIKTVDPQITQIAKASRAFLVRVVTFLAAEAGIGQFLTVGTGLHMVDNTHQVAQRVAPRSRTVYVDNDPMVLAHARAWLTSTAEGACDWVDADVRDPAPLLAAARKTLDLTEPVGLMMLGVLGHVVSYDQARMIVRQLVSVLPPGSCLVVNDGTNVIDQKGRDEATRLSVDAGTPYIARSPQQIAGFFDGLDLLEPGVVSTPRWLPDPGAGDLPDELDVYCGVGRKR